MHQKCCSLSLNYWFSWILKWSRIHCWFRCCCNCLYSHRCVPVLQKKKGCKVYISDASRYIYIYIMALVIITNCIQLLSLFPDTKYYSTGDHTGGSFQRYIDSVIDLCLSLLCTNVGCILLTNPHDWHPNWNWRHYGTSYFSLRLVPDWLRQCSAVTRKWPLPLISSMHQQQGPFSVSCSE